MFDLAIVRSDNFLDMSLSTQALYFHLGMNADDDGFISPKMIMRMLGSTPDELKVLIAKEYIIPFKDGVVVIKDWKINNTIRSDRHKPTLYQTHLKNLKVLSNNSYELGIPDDNQSDELGIPNDNQRYTQYSIVENSIVESSIVENSIFNESKKKNKSSIKEDINENKKTKKEKDTRIDELINHLISKAELTTLDGTNQKNRFYAKLLLDKLKKIYPDKNELKLAKDLIVLGLQDKYIASNMTSISYVYYNIQKIINSYQQNQNYVFDASTY